MEEKLEEAMQLLLEFPFDSRQELSEMQEQVVQGYVVVAEKVSRMCGGAHEA